MANTRYIVTEEDPRLHEPCVEVRRFNETLHNLLDDMAVTMYHADGVGLAAPQVGINKCVIVVDDREHGLIEMVNPRIVKSSGAEDGLEYCLSVPDRGGMVTRFTKIDVEAQDRNGNPFRMHAEDFLARVFQHEIDHLSGTLFTDVMYEEIMGAVSDETPLEKRPRRRIR